MGAWIREELQGIDLLDRRLNQRASQLLERLSADPCASVNAACQGWGETQAAYRFFDNPRVTPERLLEPHRQATLRRIAAEEVVLLVQDTTELDYSTHPAEGMGSLDWQQRRGFYDHTTLALTPDGLCLGVLNVHLFSRDGKTLGKSQQRRNDPIETKESFRWLEGYRLACDLAATNQTQVVSVADCEADLYDIFVEAERREPTADFVIRAKVDRRLPERDTEAGGDVYLSAWNHVATTEPIATRTLTLERTPQRKARTATLEVRARRLTLKTPHARRDDPQVTLGLVLVEEVDGPEDGTAVRWKLLTSLPVESANDTLRVLDYYTARWGIEVFFRVLKTGCRVEDIQLETSQRLQNCLMLYKIIAWRVLYLTYLGRECPNLPCSAVFADVEWRPTWQIATGKQPPEDPPPLNTFLQQLAQLGGHNNRSQDAPPGPHALWIGLRRMTDFAIAWQSFQKNNYDVCK